MAGPVQKRHGRPGHLTVMLICFLEDCCVCVWGGLSSNLISSVLPIHLTLHLCQTLIRTRCCLASCLTVYLVVVFPGSPSGGWGITLVLAS